MDGQGLSVTKSALTEPMVISVSANAVVTVSITLYVTNKLAIVTGDVTRDIQTLLVVTNVNPVILGWLATEPVATIV